MKPVRIQFATFLDTLSDVDREKIYNFFEEFDLQFVTSKAEKRKFRYDFESSISELYERGVAIDEILSRLALSNLGGFYARPSVSWFPLDDAAKIYPISMEHGRQLMFRISVYFKEDVIPELLQMALNFTMKRFPTFATTLKKGIFWHYLDSVKKHFSVIEENDVPCQPIKVSLSGSNSFRVLYYKNRISAEFFHVLTDGTGGMTFLQVLAVEYLRLCGIKYPDREGLIWDVNGIPAIEEFENSFREVDKADTTSGFIEKAAVQMNGKLTRRKPCRIIHFKMDAEKLHSTAKSRGITVTAYLLSLMFLACRRSCDELRGDINIQVPVNMRKYYHSTTMRNFSLYCGIRIPIEKIGDRSWLESEISSQLVEKSKEEKMHEMVTGAVSIVSSIRLLPLVIKQPIAKMVYGFLGEKLYTTTFSNLGVVKLPEGYENYVDYMDFCLGAQMTNRLACAAITFGNTAVFSISKMTADPSFEEKMYQMLVDDGICVETEGSEYYAN